MALANARDEILRGTAVQSDKVVPARNGINPITSQVGTRSHLGLPGTDLRSMKVSEETGRTKVRAELVRTSRVHLTTSVMRRCAKY